MFGRFRKWNVVSIMFFLCTAFLVSSQAQTLKHKANFNQNWKFLKSDPGTAAAGTTYNDAAWASVNIPHSPSYDSLAPASEQAYFVGTCWYRKSFTLPANVKLAFIEVEGAMQVCTLYVNGTRVGYHNNSGYTPFVLNISNQLVRGGNNIMAVRLNNAKSADIPPGWGSAGPDYNLYGGLHRPVWIHFKDSVYIPVYTQQVLPMPNASATSSQLRVRTQVMNASKTAQNATVMVSLFNASNTQIISTTATKLIPQGTQYLFDTTTASFACSPWTPQTPAMYSVRTLVTVGGVVVDSVSEPCGFRSFTWSATNGFSINGTRTEIRGMCVHQAFSWIENAVPDWRYSYEVKVLKAMGCNSIRCAHYPRSQAFYDACDKLGMLVYPEIPSWGWSMNPSTACWTKMDSCVREMVTAGRNHPSIYMWGLYNEPNQSSSPQDFTPYITTMNNTAHSLDSTRPTCIANNPSGTLPTCQVVPDILGLNYNTSSNVTVNGKSTATMPWINCESRNPSTFGTRCFRGSKEDLDTTDVATGANDATEWASFNFTNATSGHMAGGHFWCWKDYNSSWNTGAAEGVTDPYDVPKTLYYYIAKKWNPAFVTDYPRPGVSTKIDFQVDTNSLPADSVNVFLLTATLRDANNHQISSDSCQVRFTLSDPTKGIIFGGNLVKALGGRAAVFLRTSKSPGTFFVTASYVCNTALPTQTVTLTTNSVPAETYIGSTGVRQPVSQVYIRDQVLNVTHASNGIVFHCPQSSGHLQVIDSRGRTIYSHDVRNGASLFVSKHYLNSGLFYGVWDDGKQRLVSRVMTCY